jgi:RNA polymerase sigma-70 factor (ECF subfamily)
MASEGDSSDEACLRALARDSSQAFTALFERYGDAVYNCAFRRTASWSAAEDIAETVFFELWRQRHRVVACGGSVRPWLLGVAANQSRRWWRERTRRNRAVERLASREGHDVGPGGGGHGGRRSHGGHGGLGDDLADLVAARVDDERRMAGLLAAVQQLPAPQQDVLTLWVWEGLGYDEIAVALDVRVGTVKSRLSRARERLQAIEGTAAGLRASTVEPSNPAATAMPPDAEQQGGSR